MQARTLITGTILIVAPAAIASAQQCDAPRPNCAPTCAPGVVSMNPPTPAPPPSRGSYVRGPATGAAASEANSLGLRGFALHIPEMRLALPTIELPSLVRYRRDAEKIFDMSRGPYTDGEITETGMLPQDGPFTPFNAPANCIAPGPAPAATPCTDATFDQRLQRLQALEEELAMLRREMRPAAPAVGTASVGTRASRVSAVRQDETGLMQTTYERVAESPVLPEEEFAVVPEAEPRAAITAGAAQREQPRSPVAKSGIRSWFSRKK